MGKKQREFKGNALGAWFLNRGEALAQRAIRPHTARIDYTATHRLINKDTTTKYNRSITRELDLRDQDAFKSELCDLFLTCSTRKPHSQQYPKMQSSTWQTMIGIKPSTKTLIGAFRDILITMYRDILEAKRKGTLENTHITETVKYLFARHIAHKYSHDKRGTPKAMNTVVNTGLIHKGYTFTDDEGNTTQDVIDSRSEEFIDEAHKKMLCQQIERNITDIRDKAAFEIYCRTIIKDTTVEKEHQRELRKYQKLGLRTPAAVRQRMHRIKRIPQVKPLNPYR